MTGGDLFVLVYRATPTSESLVCGVAGYLEMAKAWKYSGGDHALVYIMKLNEILPPGTPYSPVDIS